MGYTHYWKQLRDFNGEQWADVCRFTADAIELHEHTICGADGTGKPEINGDIIALNGCGIDGASYEDFFLSREAEAETTFCKTERRNYDPLVVAVLLFIHKRCSDVMVITSDGDIFPDLGSDDKWNDRTTAIELLDAIVSEVKP